MNPYELIQRYLRGEATAAEVGELERLLANDASLRRKLVVEVGIDAGLQEIARERVLQPMAVLPQRSKWLNWRSLAVAATVAAVAILGLSWQLTAPSLMNIGTVTQVLNAESAGEGAGPVVGQSLSAGRVALNRGAMEITLSNGVTLLYEGPGELELLSPMRVLLHSGQVVVRVPQNAIGFQVDAPTARIVDLGTEFAVKAGPGLETDVQVFEGVVEASPSGGGFVSQILAGNAARYTPENAAAKVVAYSESRFLRKLPIQPGIPVPAKAGKREFHKSRHSEAVIHSLAKKIHVDGDLADWSEEGRFFSERDATRSVEGRMRYDAEAFYVAAHIKDPSPMRNSIDPWMDGELGWKGGALQVRLSLDRALGWPVDANGPTYYSLRDIKADAEQIARAANERLVTMTLWHHEPSASDCLHLAYGVDHHGGVVNPPGYEAVFKRDADNAGYIIEARVPWELLHAQEDPPRAGDVLGVCWNTHWSDPTGRLWQTNLIELRNPAEPLRIYDFERAATWGRAIYR